jgi:hypothetical protein
MTPVRAPQIRWPALLLTASLVACGSSSGGESPLPDASTDDGTAIDAASANPGDGPIAGDDAAGDAAAEGPDADDCAGVRCAAPPACGLPCTSRCCCNQACPADGGSDGAATRLDAATPDAGASCTSAGDCRLFSDMCDGCTCVPLAASAADPVCTGSQVSCLRNPCDGLSAACVGGRCTQMP